MHTRRFTPWLYLGPTLTIIILFLIYPSIYSIYLSFFDKNSENFVGASNYIYSFTNRNTLKILQNNGLWMVVFTPLTVFLGLMLAILLDRIRYEATVKLIFFMPTALSFVSASIMWRLIYAYRPSPPQIGLLNAFRGVFHLSPVGWLIKAPWINNLCLIAVGVWTWIGFCMIILSASYKNLPRELLEAARIDGANEWRIFWKIIFPLMMPTIIVLITIQMINVLKIFDIIYVMTGGNFDTEVLAGYMYKQMFYFMNYGRATTIAVLLLLLTLPAMLINLKQFKAQGVS